MYRESRHLLEPLAGFLSHSAQIRWLSLLSFSISDLRTLLTAIEDHRTVTHLELSLTPELGNNAEFTNEGSLVTARGGGGSERTDEAASEEGWDPGVLRTLVRLLYCQYRHKGHNKHRHPTLFEEVITTSTTVTTRTTAPLLAGASAPIAILNPNNSIHNSTATLSQELPMSPPIAFPLGGSLLSPIPSTPTLVETECCCFLAHLALSGTQLSDACVSLLGFSLAINHSLTYLDLSDNPFGRAGCEGMYTHTHTHTHTHTYTHTHTHTIYIYI